MEKEICEWCEEVATEMYNDIYYCADHLKALMNEGEAQWESLKETDPNEY